MANKVKLEDGNIKFMDSDTEFTSITSSASKTLNFDGSVIIEPQIVTDLQVNLSNGNNFHFLNSTGTTLTFNNFKNGQSGNIILNECNITTVSAEGMTILWKDGTPPQLNSNGTHVLSYYCFSNLDNFIIIGAAVNFIEQSP